MKSLPRSCQPFRPGPESSSATAILAASWESNTMNGPPPGSRGGCGFRVVELVGEPAAFRVDQDCARFEQVGLRPHVGRPWAT